MWEKQTGRGDPRAVSTGPSSIILPRSSLGFFFFFFSLCVPSAVSCDTVVTDQSGRDV